MKLFSILSHDGAIAQHDSLSNNKKNSFMNMRRTMYNNQRRLTHYQHNYPMNSNDDHKVDALDRLKQFKIDEDESKNTIIPKGYKDNYRIIDFDFSQQNVDNSAQSAIETSMQPEDLSPITAVSPHNSKDEVVLIDMKSRNSEFSEESKHK